MGGIGSGARRSTQIGNVEDTLTLDIRALRRLGIVQAGECVCNTVRWSSGGLNATSIRLRVDLEHVAHGGIASITGDMPDGGIYQRVAIKAVPSGFGGWRCYFICPVTAKRCEVLYYAGGRFASREAQRLSYAVQGMTDTDRARRRVAKLHRRLQGCAGFPRPRGRNRIEMTERLCEARAAARALYHERLAGIVKNTAPERLRGGSAIRQVPSSARARPKDT